MTKLHLRPWPSQCLLVAVETAWPLGRNVVTTGSKQRDLWVYLWYHLFIRTIMCTIQFELKPINLPDIQNREESQQQKPSYRLLKHRIIVSITYCKTPNVSCLSSWTFINLADIRIWQHEWWKGFTDFRSHTVSHNMFLFRGQ